MPRIQTHFENIVANQKMLVGHFLFVLNIFNPVLKIYCKFVTESPPRCIQSMTHKLSQWVILLDSMKSYNSLYSLEVYEIWQLVWRNFFFE